MGLRLWLGLRKPPRPPAFVSGFSALHGRAQIYQDLWVLSETGSKRGGFFVEVGAFDGVTLSNTYLLEKEFGWTGILAEPNPLLIEKIEAARSAPLCKRPVDATSGREVAMLFVPDAPELSGMSDFAFGDQWAEKRAQGTKTRQTTISLNDMLASLNAPREIDFMSIDTEGSELAILSTFDFDRYRVSLFAIEHNRTDANRRLDELLIPRGYERVYREWSQWDAWYRLIP